MLKHTPRSENPADYPDALTWLGDQPLNDNERAMLNIEKKVWRFAGAKAQAIRGELGWSSTYYYLQLNHLIEDPRAMREEPFTVKRLQRIRDSRRSGRSIRHLTVV